MSELTSSLDDSKFSIVMNYQPCDYANQAKSGKIRRGLGSVRSHTRRPAISVNEY